jgi:ATP-dependent helicase/nuclease subunit A
MKMPRRLIAGGDEVLAGQLAVADASACFDELCVLYVAMTRAKRGLYLISSFPGRTSKTVTAAAFLKRRLHGEPCPTNGEPITIDGENAIALFEAGQRDWYLDVEAVEPQPVEQKTGALAQFRDRGSGRRRLTSVSPSRQAEGEEAAGTLFAESLGDGLSFGTALHELFEHMAWSDDGIEGSIRAWCASTTCAPDLRARAEEVFRRVLELEDVRRALARPEGVVELWRERSFELVLGNEWVTGSFDRVVIRKDDAGRPVSAVVLDYKSNRVETTEEIEAAAEHYRPQLALYTRALSRLIGLDPEHIEQRLLFTHPGRVVDL